MIMLIENLGMFFILNTFLELESWTTEVDGGLSKKLKRKTLLAQLQWDFNFTKGFNHLDAFLIKSI